jgi:hypothetical protein
VTVRARTQPHGTPRLRVAAQLLWWLSVLGSAENQRRLSVYQLRGGWWGRHYRHEPDRTFGIVLGEAPHVAALAAVVVHKRGNAGVFKPDAIAPAVRAGLRGRHTRTIRRTPDPYLYPIAQGPLSGRPHGRWSLAGRSWPSALGNGVDGLTLLWFKKRDRRRAAARWSSPWLTHSSQWRTGRV